MVPLKKPCTTPSQNLVSYKKTNKIVPPSPNSIQNDRHLSMSVCEEGGCVLLLLYVVKQEDFFTVIGNTRDT